MFDQIYLQAAEQYTVINTVRPFAADWFHYIPGQSLMTEYWGSEKVARFAADPVESIFSNGEHLHNYIELGYVYRGDFTEIIKDRAHHFRAGEFFLIDSNCIHRDDYTGNESIVFFLCMKQEFFDEVFLHGLRLSLNPLSMETYPADIARLWEIVERQPHVIGDMTWTGYDYIGESGCGIFYYDGRMGFGENWPASLSYIGDIDLIGNRRSISYYREVVYGLRRKPCIAVQRLNHYGETPSKTSWMFSDSLASWTWTGYEEKSAVIEIYSDAEEVELFLNGRSLGKKPAGPKNQYLAVYEAAYEPGRLEAVNIRHGQAAETEVLMRKLPPWEGSLQLSTRKTYRL